jgi:hypothetical protein
MTVATTVTATFTLKTYGLTVDTNGGTGAGTVTSTDTFISCPGTCSHTYSHGASVTLNAVADGSSTFTGWSGGGCSGIGSCVVSMTAVTTVTATFVHLFTGTPAVTPAVLVKSTTNSVDVAFTLADPWPADGKLVITFPSGFDVSGVAATATASGADGTFTVAVVGQVVTVTRGGGTNTAAATPVTITLSGVTNPATAGVTGTFALAAQTSAGGTINVGTAPGVTITD